jgi:DNA polymerase-3 subunit beta
MQLLLDRKQFLESLSKVSSLVEKRNLLPILDMVKITINNKRVTLTTTDLDVTCQDSFNLEEFDEDLDFLVPLHPLFEITKKLSNYEKIAINLTDLERGQIEILAGPSQVTISTMSTEEFPSFEPILEEKVAIPVRTIRELFNKTKHAISGGEMRYYLNGIHLDTDDLYLNAAATDVHRLAIVQRNKPENLELTSGILIPKKAALEILKLLDTLKEEDFFNLQVNDTKLAVEINNSHLTTKLLNGQFPNYKSVFNLKPYLQILVPLEEFVRALELVSAIADTKVKIVKLTLVNNLLTVSLENSKDGRGSRALQELIVEAKYLDARPEAEINLSLLLNAKYLLDLLDLAQGTKIAFLFSGFNSPLLVKDEIDDLSLFVLMPMQLDVNN